MSIERPTEHDLHVAALTGMGNFHGDAEVAEDLGIATTPETYDSHVLSANSIAYHTGPASEARRLDHEYYERKLGLSGYQELSAEQIAVNQAGAAAVKAALQEARNKPAS